MEFLEVGKIVNTHALKGEVKIKSYSKSDRFIKDNILYLGPDHIEVKVKSHRFNEGFHYCVFYDYEDINLILPFKNKFLYIKESDLEELNEDEYYIKDLINLEVFNENNKLIGKVIEVREYPANYMLEIKKSDGKIALVPFRKEFVISISDKIIIHEIEGLIWK